MAYNVSVCVPGNPVLAVVHSTTRSMAHTSSIQLLRRPCCTSAVIHAVQQHLASHITSAHRQVLLLWPPLQPASTLACPSIAPPSSTSPEP